MNESAFRYRTRSRFERPISRIILLLIGLLPFSIIVILWHTHHGRIPVMPDGFWFRFGAMPLSIWVVWMVTESTFNLRVFVGPAGIRVSQGPLRIYLLNPILPIESCTWEQVTSVSRESFKRLPAARDLEILRIRRHGGKDLLLPFASGNLRAPVLVPVEPHGSDLPAAIAQYFPLSAPSAETSLASTPVELRDIGKAAEALSIGALGLGIAGVAGLLASRALYLESATLYPLCIAMGVIIGSFSALWLTRRTPVRMAVAPVSLLAGGAGAFATWGLLLLYIQLTGIPQQTVFITSTSESGILQSREAPSQRIRLRAHNRASAATDQGQVIVTVKAGPWGIHTMALKEYWKLIDVE